MTLFSKHQALLQEAIAAFHDRKFYTPYPENHQFYDKEGPEKGLEKYKDLLNRRFEEMELQSGSNMNWVGEEKSPYTGEYLGIEYPQFDASFLLDQANEKIKHWRKVSIENRAGVLIEVIERIKERFFELAYATMHTSGQSFMMAFQASGPHAMDRALEAIVLGYHELKRFPGQVDWIKPIGKTEVKLEKVYTAVPKGVGLVIGCSTFPVWNSVPGIFANLMAGNPVIVKPHSKAVLPMAMVVAEIQKALKSEGYDPLTVQMATDSAEKLIAQKLAESEIIKLIDYTGGAEFGNYLENLKGKQVFTEKTGVNSVIMDSVENLDEVLQNLAFSITLYSGQMCTAPQNFFIPKNGVKEGDKLIPYAEVSSRFKKAVSDLVNHPKIGLGTLAAIQSDQTLERVSNIEGSENITTSASELKNEHFPNARICTPRILEVDAAKREKFDQEYFGPIVLLIQTKDTDESIQLAKSLALEKGAISCGAYTLDEAVEQKIYDEMEMAYVPVSLNFVGFIWMNQAAAFSDFHVSGGNPAGNASFTNPEYVNKRFTWIGHRKKI